VASDICQARDTCYDPLTSIQSYDAASNIWQARPERVTGIGGQAVAAQVEFESKVRKRFIKLQFQALS
jgi:hypothetical protein